MSEIWVNRGELNRKAVLELSARYRITPEFAALLLKRSLTYEEIIQPTRTVSDSRLFKDMEKGIDIAAETILTRKRSCVVNDYDVDGATSGVIMKEALSVCGADTFILTPRRNVDGYGMSVRIVDEAYRWGAELIITTDNGIAAYEAVEHAKSLNMRVVITDHHEVPFDENGEIIPPADAVIDAKQKNCRYPFKEICGAEVALKFAILLFDKFKIDKDTRNRCLRRFTELAAIGTICDVMPLIKENRALVKAGLELLKTSQIVGLRQLMKVQSIDPSLINTYNIGFGIGPCINSMSRLYDDSDTVLELLEERDYLKADKLASTLSKANSERKTYQEKAMTKALDLIGECRDNIIILYLENCNPALMGLVAGKVKEMTGRPSICLTDSEDGILKGSGRSTDNYDMFGMLSRHRDLYSKFGGHPGAVGLSIAKENLNSFIKLINEDAKDLIFDKKVFVDLYMPMSEVSEKFLNEISLMEPFGEGNEEPLFCDETARLISFSPIGKEGQYTSLIIESNNKKVRAVWFKHPDLMKNTLSEVGIPTEGTPLSILYTPRFNTWNGNTTISYNINSLKVR
ncbi:MAG: single-stranded-DNA-specific exonuclease RecJ [Lachnospiraceae bacterium]|nr:single-stranded-DNA-specific exonuclease RecJ [Lachnospiraceae bacterium]